MHIINIYIYIYFITKIFNKFQFDKNGTMCTFRLETNGFQIRVTVLRIELHVIEQEKLGNYFNIIQI